MKNKILIFFILALGISTHAQIALEHKYDSASYLGTVNNNCYNQLMIVSFEVSGERYVKINRVAKTICLYDMTHSLLKTVSLASFPMMNNGTMGDVIYLSEQLFNTDNKMEFMYLTYNGSIYTTKIINEDGIELFSDTGAAGIHSNFEQQQLPIYNTPAGTKMILSYRNAQAWVFSLGGKLTAAIQEANGQLMQAQSISNPYPNPTDNNTRVDYILPDGVNQGEIVFYDLHGKEIKRFKVDRTFDSLLISTTDIPAGTYYYQLQTSAQASEGKKVVVIK